jgi:hypothetical protein
MSKQQHPPVTDTDNIPEVFCDGQMGPFAAISRPSPSRMSAPIRHQCSKKDGTARATAVVAARVVITVPNLIALRDLLNRVITAPQQPAPPAGGPTVH